MYVAIRLPSASLASGNSECADAMLLCLGAVRCRHYSEHEAEEPDAGSMATGRSPDVVFVPFGRTSMRSNRRWRPPLTTSSSSAPIRNRTRLLLRIAERMPQESFRLVIGREQARAPPAPENVAVEVDLPFADMLARLAAARIVALRYARTAIRRDDGAAAGDGPRQACGLTRTRRSQAATGWSMARTARSSRP